MDINATWIGVGVKSGGQLLFGGVESFSGMFFNLGNLHLRRTFSITSSRWGFGLGGGGGVGVICIFKSNELWWLDGQEMSDWGVNISLGEKWKDIAWFLSDKKFFAIVRAISNNPVAFFQNISNLREVMSLLFAEYDFATDSSQHPILSFDVPLAGVGLELSAFKKSGKIWIDSD